jgi:uncharacterized sulfatase
VTNKIFSLPEGIFNIARLLQDAGYRNQRLAHDYYPEYLMENRGFVELTGNVTSDNKQVAKLKAVNTAGRVHQAALDFIKRNRDRLFYLQLDYNLPDVNKYLERIGNSGFEQDGPGRYVNEDWDAREKGYGEMVGLMDDYLGELIAQLRYLGIDNNTLVIFTSDNGPAGTRGMESFDRFNATGGLRGNKGKLWESKTPVKKLVCCDRTRSWVSRSVI